MHLDLNQGRVEGVRLRNLSLNPVIIMAREEGPAAFEDSYILLFF